MILCKSTQFMALILVSSLMLIACGSNTAVIRYGEHMNPLLEKHIDLYTVDLPRIMEDFESTANVLSTSPNADMTNRTQSVEPFTNKLESVRREIEYVIGDWLLLEPPADAQQYHKLVLEMMELRSRGIEFVGIGYTLLGESQIDSSANRLEQASEIIDRSDRLWVDVLSEGSKLGVTRN